MKYEVGDTILVLHSDEEGKVIEIINEKMVLIEVRGVKFPAYMDQIDFPYFKRFSAQKLVPEKKPTTFIDSIPKENQKKIQKRASTGVLLALLPVFNTDEFGDDYVVTLKIHLQNNTEDELNFTYKLQEQGHSTFEIKSQILPFHDFYLHDVAFEAMNNNPQFWFEFSQTKTKINKAPYYETLLKMKAKQLFTRIAELQKSGAAFFSYELFKEYPDRTAEPIASELPDTNSMDISKLAAFGFKVNSKKNRKAESIQTTIDLHIDKLREDWRSMDKSEILHYQLSEFEKQLDKIYGHRLPQMTVIHGVGKGRLKEEIHEILKYKSEVKNFVHQYHPWYGYGATEIYFNI